MLAHIIAECPDVRHPKLKLYISERNLDIYHISGTPNNALHDLTIIEVTVVRFFGTGGFLSRYSNGHKK